GLRDVVGAGAAATPVGFLERHDVEARDGREQSSRLGANLLTMEKMTGIVPGHSPAERSRLLGHAEITEVFGRVAGRRGEERVTSGRLGVVVQVTAVLLHPAAAAH